MSVTQYDKVSIRLMSDGHAFSAIPAQNGEALSQVADVLKGGVVAEVMLCTPKTLLVPAEQLEALSLEEHLALSGLAPAQDERVVVSDVVTDIVAVMAVPLRHIEELELCGAELHYSSPLLMGDMSEACVVALYGNLLYVRVADDQLRFADVMEVTTDVDILYYLGAIDTVYHIYNMASQLAGDTSRLLKLCKPLFRKILCE